MSDPRFRQVEWTPELIARFWAWESQFPERYFTYQFGDRIALRLTPHLAGATRALDLGCGVGYLLPHLARHATQVAGADLSAEAVMAANARMADVPNFIGAFTLDTLAKRSERFDVITVIEVIEHLTDDQLAILFDTVRRFLAPDGRVIFTTPNDEDLEQNMIYCPVSEVVFHRWQHVRSWDAGSLRRHLEGEGFAVEEIAETDLSRRPLWSVKGMLRRLHDLIQKPGRPPHLVCVARRATEAS